MNKKEQLVSMSVEISFIKKQSTRTLLGVTIREIASNIADRFISIVSSITTLKDDMIGNQTEATQTGESGRIDVEIFKNGKPSFSCFWADSEHSGEYLVSLVLATLYEIIPNWNK